MRGSFHTTMIGVLLFLQIAHLKSWADELKTRDGKTLHGAIKLLDGDIVQVGETRVPLNNVKRLALDQPQVPPDEVRKSADEFWAVRQAGALSWRGTFIARSVKAMDDTKVSFQDAPKGLFLSTPNTAAVFFRPLSLRQAHRLRGRRPGLLLQSGDFMEGELLGIQDGRIKMESVLFGRKSFDMAEAVALWLQPPRSMGRPQFAIRTNSGSYILTDKLSLQTGAVLLDGSPLRKYRLAQNQILTIEHGAVTDVLTQAWAKVDNAPPGKKAELMATRENLSRTIQLRGQLQGIELKLAEAKVLMLKAEEVKAKSSAKRQSIMENRKRLQNEWKQMNREHWKTRSNKLRTTNQAQTKRQDVARAQRKLKNAERSLDRQTGKLAVFEKEIARPNAKPQKEERRKRDALTRPIERAKRDMQRAQQELEDARRNNNKIQAEAKPLEGREEDSKKALDKAKKEIDREMLAYRQSIAEYQVSTRQASITRSKVSTLQQEKDRVTQQLEGIKPKIPVPTPNK